MSRHFSRGCKKMDGSWWLKLVRERVPIVRWLPTYSSNDFISDLIAGVTVGLTVMPQGLAYATLAGLEPQVLDFCLTPFQIATQLPMFRSSMDYTRLLWGVSCTPSSAAAGTSPSDRRPWWPWWHTSRSRAEIHSLLFSYVSFLGLCN